MCLVRKLGELEENEVGVARILWTIDKSGDQEGKVSMRREYEAVNATVGREESAPCVQGRSRASVRF